MHASAIIDGMGAAAYAAHPADPVAAMAAAVGEYTEQFGKAPGFAELSMLAFGAHWAERLRQPWQAGPVHSITFRWQYTDDVPLCSVSGGHADGTEAYVHEFDPDTLLDGDVPYFDASAPADVDAMAAVLRKWCGHACTLG